VRQVGYLQRLYRDARSTEHKKLPVLFITQAEYVHSAVRTDCLDVVLGNHSL